MKIKLFFLGIVMLMAFALLGQRAEDYVTVIPDGAWCWFSDPRSVYHQGDFSRVYTGAVNSNGDVVVNQYDPNNGHSTEFNLYQGFEKDDHVNPSILILPDHRIMVFFTKHGGHLYYATTTNPEDITSFNPIDSMDLGSMACYTNPVLLTEENNRIYLFYRGGTNWKPSFIYSDDLGSTWSGPQTLVSKLAQDNLNRPYTKVYSDGRSTIHFAFTDGHPRIENHNSIYYLKYESGKFMDAAGNTIGDTSLLPIRQDRIPKAYDGVAQNARAWIWDIAVDQENNPVFVYTTLPEETKHEYHYAQWNENQWAHQRLCAAGSAFPRFKRPKENRDPEPHYSGGITLDHHNPAIVYLSRPINDRFEIEQWITSDGGQSFTRSKITEHSLQDNIRPFVIRNAPEAFHPGLLWMYVDSYEHYTQYKTSIKGNLLADRYDAQLSSEAITKVMEAVADWQIDRFDLVKHHRLDWTNGALYAGMMEWAKISENPKYLNWLEDIGWRFGWQPHQRMYHADDIVVSQMYLEMYRLKQDQENSYRILGPTQARLDYVLRHPSQASLELDYRNPATLERWSWCDALFMAPPVYAQLSNITEDDSYLEFMDKEYKVTYDYLYDSDEHLFYRDHRYFPEKIREANGAKVFWGRGNGWVMGGLVALLKELPKDSPYRTFYENLFVEMAHKVITCQDEKGFWHASLLDPKSFPTPETSSSAFFTYALTYGVNAGLLDDSVFGPKVKQGWQALVSAVHADGKLGWVQPIGQDPKEVTAEMTEVYGVGAFLLAGTEMLKLIEK